MAKRNGIEMDEEKLLLEANRWELNHGGMFCTPVTPGTPLLWPSEDTVSTPSGPLAVKAMDEQDMHEVAEYFANAARLGKRGGFDVVNVHAARLAAGGFSLAAG